MYTFNQLVKNKRKRIKKFHKTRTSALLKCPHKRGICLKLLKEKPKKPNSAKRSVAKVKLSTGKSVRAHIPGEGHRLIKFNRVLLRGGRVRDLPGVKYRVVRGKYDCLPVAERRQGYSKYGLKMHVIIELEKMKVS